MPEVNSVPPSSRMHRAYKCQVIGRIYGVSRAHREHVLLLISRAGHIFVLYIPCSNHTCEVVCITLMHRMSVFVHSSTHANAYQYVVLQNAPEKNVEWSVMSCPRKSETSSHNASHCRSLRKTMCTVYMMYQLIGVNWPIRSKFASFSGIYCWATWVSALTYSIKNDPKCFPAGVACRATLSCSESINPIWEPCLWLSVLQSPYGFFFNHSWSAEFAHPCLQHLEYIGDNIKLLKGWIDKV